MTGKVVCVAISVLWGASLSAETSQAGNAEEKAKIRRQLAAIKALDPKDYSALIGEHRLALEKYIQHKRRVCDGEFSTEMLEEGLRPREGEIKKLSPKERLFCFDELRGLQTIFINNMHTAHKKYLTWLHQRRLKDLDKSRRLLIENLRPNKSRKSRSRR